MNGDPKSSLTQGEKTWDPKLGPKPLPTWHGKGCTCNQWPNVDCPAAQTEEGKARTRQRELNGARMRLRNAEVSLLGAIQEVISARRALDNLEPGP